MKEATQAMLDALDGGIADTPRASIADGLEDIKEIIQLLLHLQESPVDGKMDILLAPDGTPVDCSACRRDSMADEQTSPWHPFVLVTTPSGLRFALCRGCRLLMGTTLLAAGP